MDMMGSMASGMSEVANAHISATEDVAMEGDIIRPKIVDEDDTASSMTGTEHFDRSSTDASSARKWPLDPDGDWRRHGSSESALSTGISSMCSSVVADEAAEKQTINLTSSKKRMADGSLKQTSLAHAFVNETPLSSPAPDASPFPGAGTSSQLFGQQGSPSKITFTDAKTKVQTSTPRKTSRSINSSLWQTQARPRSSIPVGVPAHVLASQCVEAALGSRLSPYELHPGEHELLSAQLSPKQVTIYLNIRNRILRLWKRNSLCSVSADEALGCAKESRYFGLADVAYKWLMRNGYINFGCVEVPDGLATVKLPAKASRQRTVVVIGAGVSGLTTARQLEGLFMQEAAKWVSRGEQPPRVIVLEGRKRVGGRVYSKPFQSQVTGSLPDGLRNTAEMGAMIVTGFEHGNPLDTIIRAQLGLRYHLMRDTLTIYDEDGQSVEEQRDMLATELYTDISDRAGEFRALPQKQDTLRGDEDLINRGRDPAPDGFVTAELEPLTAGQIKSHQPAARRGRRRNAPPGTEKLTGRTQVVEGGSARLSASRAVKNMGWQVKEGVAKNQSISLHRTAAAVTHPTLGSVMDEAIEQYKDMIDITPTDMKLLNWHHANLEYANAAPVTSLSLSGHDQDTGNEFEGAHSEVVGGYTQVPRGLLNLPTRLDVRFGSIVESIHYDGSRTDDGKCTTKVVCSKGEVFEADEVVLTTPLGVLKSNAVAFHPPLPSWKQGAIDRMGFGLLNKVILLYEKVFWDEDRDMFGLLNAPEKPGSLDPKDYEKNRGRFYLIWNASKTSGRPMLIALMAGNAAYEAEDAEPETLVDEVTGRLRGVFGAEVPKPMEVIVTRWRRDRFTRGTYSFVAPETQAGDYDIMAKPVGNLHFAGEATCGTHPATVHGALLSGLRVAAEVVESMVGAIELPNPLVAQQSNALEALGSPATSQSSPGRRNVKVRVPSLGAPVPGASPALAPIKTESSRAVSLTSIPAAKNSRSHFVLAPAGPPVQSVCASDPSFWISSSSRDHSGMNQEARITAQIVAQIGERPLKPGRSGVNPFLLYTKEKWNECKAACSKGTSSAGRDVIRQTLGKWWKAADAAARAPYVEQSHAAQERSDAERKVWESEVAQWDADALRIRRELTQPSGSATAPVAAAAPEPADLTTAIPASSADPLVSAEPVTNEIVGVAAAGGATAPVSATSMSETR